MAWWVLTYLRIRPETDALLVEASTNFADHLFMSWAYHMPRREPIYVKVRGTLKFCGYKYIWDTPNIEEQMEAGDSIEHTFGLSTLIPLSTVWFYLWAPGGPYGLEIQSPLFSVRLLEVALISARAYHHEEQEFMGGSWHPLIFVLQRWDTDHIHDPVMPYWTRLTCRTPGLYVISGHAAFSTGEPVAQGIAIRLNGDAYIALSKTGTPNPEEPQTLCISTQYLLEEDDYLELEVYQYTDVPFIIFPEPNLSPEFMMTLISPA